MVLLSFELASAFVQLSKFAVLKVALVGVLAWVLRGTTATRLAGTGIALALAYSVLLSPLVSYGRIAFNAQGLTSVTEAGFLINDVVSHSAHDKLETLMPGVQGWWLRLSYAHAQAFAMDAYDSGEPGDTFKLWIWVFVPRLIYPDKPVTTTGEEFNGLLNGNYSSKSAPGMLAEGYWNSGWIGLIMVALVMAGCFWAWELYTDARLSTMTLQYLPVMWMGLFPAIQQDSWFIPGTLGIFPFAVVFHWLARAFPSPPPAVAQAMAKDKPSATMVKGVGRPVGMLRPSTEYL
jgi:hypothetical protein